MREVMLTLGSFRFQLATAAYDRLRRTAEYRWPGQERLTRGPARQFVGLGNETVELSGVLYPTEHGGPAQLDALRDYAARGEPQTLTTGTGDVLGRWCVERVEEAQSVFFADGAPRKIEFTLTLARYAED